MADIEFVTVDVFTQVRFGGNPLAVIPDARGLSDAQMQSIAREFNYAETTFVLPPGDPRNTARVRIFTPTNEIPFAGHPNVGTAFVLASQASIFGQMPSNTLRFEELAGLVEIELLQEGATLTGARLTAPKGLEIGAELPPALVAACIGVSADVLRCHVHRPVMVSVGLPFVVVETDLAALAKAEPDAAAFRTADAAFPHADDRLSVFIYARDPASQAHLRARMFAPLSNTPEDPATGSAAAALGGLLLTLDQRPNATQSWTIIQGVEMGRPSQIDVDAEKRDGRLTAIRVAGSSVPVMRGVLQI